MRKPILIAAASLVLSLGGQAQAAWTNGITTHGMGVSTTVEGITLPGTHGVVVDD